MYRKKDKILSFPRSTSMSVALLWVVSPSSELTSSTIAFLEPIREGNRFLDSSRLITKDKNVFCNGLRKARKQRQNLSFLHDDSYMGGSRLKKLGKFSVFSSIVATPAGEITMSSEQKVYDVVLKQAALVNRRLGSKSNLEVKPDVVVPGNLGLLDEAYDRCGEVCAEYAKTFYLG